ncbi:P pilus assembly protein, porin PapC [Burkholderia sp. Ch1-1]|uniref:P pilus assembly protein, porin PapC n=1 Tax=Paraburkholderia dioscoreae TaxID=2604047 RepID=A0A5Q4Z2F9_9BURK|nr:MULTISPECIES: fimbria/pilus outer membrane usher protein [Paraburkholderia]EIF30038.1 P pilus assembly protein, porin PapC [Burkholderia sp. Ch1-1]MDR8396619.1 fimbrial biogenesis outer membrane usher protein [Paraburkholderia sp. USG1]VVD29912.1 P pilus assembly protein, porin PapC [Paraburkholderia dioscoreae]
MTLSSRHGGLDGGRVPRLDPLYLAVLSALLFWHVSADAAPTPSASDDVQFDSGFLAHTGGGSIDLTRFEKGNIVLPGEYSVDVYVNGNNVTRTQITFRQVGGKKDAQPCFGAVLLESLGVDLQKLPVDVRDRKPSEACIELPQIIADASTAFAFDDQRLSLSIPQSALRRTPRGYVSPDRWDSGVTTGLLNYSADVYATRNNGGPSTSQGFAGLTAGFNLGDWHFRHQGSYSWANGAGARYQDIATYVQRDMPSLTSQLTVGEAYTSGDLFDSTQFRGIKFETDDRMLPDSMRGYAPIIRGIARSNARVTITQNGVKIYEATVAPGAFEIDDLYATGYGGDLNVSVKEADGSSHDFSVPYAAVPLALRPGTHRYSFVAGTVRPSQGDSNPVFMQSTWRQGITNLITGYGGMTAAQGYMSFVLGTALNTSFGAWGLDVTQAMTSVPGEKRYNGTSARISYSKSITQTSTDIAIAAYRYSTGGFFGLNDAMLARERVRDGGLASDIARQRSRASLSVNQDLGGRAGRFGMTLSASNYWNRHGSDLTYSAAYSNVFRNLSYQLSVTRENTSLDSRNTTFYASVSIPLGKTKPVIASSSVTFDDHGNARGQATLSGSTGRDDTLFYSMTGNYASQTGGSSADGSGTLVYRAPYAELTGSAGAGQHYQQGSIGVRGAVVAHPGGITLSQPLSDTFAIVEAPGAAGARVLNSQGVRVDSRGYAIAPTLTPYSLNEIELDPSGLPLDVELRVTSQQVAPRAGAVPLIKFQTAVGRTALITVRQANGEALPFGAPVLDESGKEVGVVGQGGRILARGLETQGTLTVRWTNDSGMSCAVPYTLAPTKDGNSVHGYQTIETTCRPLPISAASKPSAE